MRSSVAPAHSAALPRREWPRTAIWLAWTPSAARRTSTQRWSPHAQAASVPHSLPGGPGEVRDVVIGVDSRGALVAGTLVAGDLVTGGLAIGRQFLAAVRREAVAPVDDAVDAPDVTAGAVRRASERSERSAAPSAVTVSSSTVTWLPSRLSPSTTGTGESPSASAGRNNASVIDGAPAGRSGNDIVTSVSVAAPSRTPASARRRPR